MKSIQRGFEILLSCLAFLSGFFMIGASVLRRMGKIADPNFATGDLIFYSILGFIFIIIGLFMLRKNTKKEER